MYKVLKPAQLLQDQLTGCPRLLLSGRFLHGVASFPRESLLTLLSVWDPVYLPSSCYLSICGRALTSGTSVPAGTSHARGARA